MSSTLSRLLALLLLMTTLVVLYFAAGLPLWRMYQSHELEIIQHREHIAKFGRLASSIGPLETKVLELERRQSATPYTLPEENENFAAASLQERVKVIVTQNGAKLSSTQVLPTVPEGNYRRVSINVRLTGSSESLQRVLYTIESGSPHLIVDSLAIRVRNVRRQITDKTGNRSIVEQVQMEIVMKLSGFMRRERA